MENVPPISMPMVIISDIIHRQRSKRRPLGVLQLEQQQLPIHMVQVEPEDVFMILVTDEEMPSEEELNEP